MALHQFEDTVFFFLKWYQTKMKTENDENKQALIVADEDILCR